MDVKINRKKIRNAVAPAASCSRNQTNRIGLVFGGQRQKTAGHPVVSSERIV